MPSPSSVLLGRKRGLHCFKLHVDRFGGFQLGKLFLQVLRTGEAERFNAVYAEYVNAPEVTRKRLFLETMEQVLGASEKVLVENGAGGSGVVPYLPLPELRSRTTTTTGAGE